MSEDVIIISIIFGTGLIIVSLGMMYSLINNWVKRKKAPDVGTLEADYKTFKTQTRKRLRHLEAIIADEDFEESRTPPIKETPERTRLDEVTEPEKESTANFGKMNNMLKS